MSYKILVTANFRQQAKRQAKKHRSLKSDLVRLEAELMEKPTLGTPLGQDCYKIRLKVTSKGKGKSGGMRVITLVVTLSENIYLLSIYDKADKENIPDKELSKLINDVKK